MNHELPSQLLETIISPTGSYKALQPHHQRTMAVELLKRRKVMAALETKLGELVIDKAELIALKTMLAGELNSN